jgi:spore coat polysaccharide biosynthesis protein SpsF
MQVAAVVPVTLADSGALALTEIAGKPALQHVLERIARVERLSGRYVVTTADAADDPVDAFCAATGTPCIRGTQADELGRVLAALKSIDAKAAAILRPTAPLIDPAIIDHVVNLIEMTDGMVDYVGTDLAPTYPRGMEVEAFTRAALDDADRRCLDPIERASATHYLRHNSRLYRLLGVKAPEEVARADLSLDVSKGADFSLMESGLIYFSGRPNASLADIIAFIDSHPHDSRP